MEQWFSYGQLCVGIQDSPINGNLEHHHATLVLPFANLIDHVKQYQDNAKLDAYRFNECQSVIDRIIDAAQAFDSLSYTEEPQVKDDTVNIYVTPKRLCGVPEPTDLADVTPDLTFGEQAVNLKFNPSGDSEVYKCKKYFASLIDQMHDLRQNTLDSETKRRASVAITEMEGAQMWAVKAITTPTRSHVIKLDPNDPKPLETVEKLKAEHHEQRPEILLPSGLVDIDALLFSSTPLGFKEVVKSVEAHQGYGEPLPGGGQFFTYGDRKVGIDSLPCPAEIYYQLQPLAIHFDDLLTC